MNVSEIEAPYTLTDRSRAEVAADLRHRPGHLPGAIVGDRPAHIAPYRRHAVGRTEPGGHKNFRARPQHAFRHRAPREGDSLEVPGTVDVNIEQQTERPQIVIKPRRELLALYGIRMPDFARAVETASPGGRCRRYTATASPTT